MKELITKERMLKFLKDLIVKKIRSFGTVFLRMTCKLSFILEIPASFTKTVAVITLSVFVYSSILAQPLYALAEKNRETRSVVEAMDELIIPYSAGRITEATYFGSDKILINIQDLHCHPEVQRNISKILSILDNRYGLKNVYLEGGVGQLDTSWVEEIDNKEVREEIIERLLSSGRLTGTEYYSINSKQYDLIKGLEYEKLYNDNILRLDKILAKRAGIQSLLPRIQKRLKELSKEYFTKKNKKLDKIISKHNDNKLSSEKYFKKLIIQAERNQIDVSQYQNVLEFNELVKLQKKFRYKKISKQLRNVIERLKQKIPYNAYKTLLERTDNFAKLDELYIYLIKISKQYNLNLNSEFADLGRFLSFVEKNQKINSIELIREEKKLIRELHAKLSESTAEREVAFLVDFFDCLDQFLANKLSAEDYIYFTRNIEDFKLLWTKYITTMARISGLGSRTSHEPRATSHGLYDLEPYYGLFDKFYSVNVERNKYFLKYAFGRYEEVDAPAVHIIPKVDHCKKIIQSLKQTKDIIVMVTGGFHSEGISKLLKDRRITYMVVTPNVTQDAKIAETVYNKLAKQQAQTINSQTIAIRALSGATLEVQELTKLNTLLDAIGERRVGKGEKPGSEAFKIASEKILTYLYKNECNKNIYKLNEKLNEHGIPAEVTPGQRLVVSIEIKDGQTVRQPYAERSGEIKNIKDETSPDSPDIFSTVSYAAENVFECIMKQQNVITGDSVTSSFVNLKDVFIDGLLGGKTKEEKEVTEPTSKEIKKLYAIYDREMSEKLTRDYDQQKERVINEVKRNKEKLTDLGFSDVIEMKVMEGITFRNRDGRATHIEVSFDENEGKVIIKVSEGFMLYEAINFASSPLEIFRPKKIRGIIRHEFRELKEIKSGEHASTPAEYHAGVTNKGHALYNGNEADLLNELLEFTIIATAKSDADGMMITDICAAANAIVEKLQNITSSSNEDIKVLPNDPARDISVEKPKKPTDSEPPKAVSSPMDASSRPKRPAGHQILITRKTQRHAPQTEKASSKRPQPKQRRRGRPTSVTRQVVQAQKVRELISWVDGPAYGKAKVYVSKSGIPLLGFEKVGPDKFVANLGTDMEFVVEVKGVEQDDLVVTETLNAPLAELHMEIGGDFIIKHHGDVMPAQSVQAIEILESEQDIIDMDGNIVTLPAGSMLVSHYSGRSQKLCKTPFAVNIGKSIFMINFDSELGEIEKILRAVSDTRLEIYEDAESITYIYKGEIMLRFFKGRLSVDKVILKDGKLRFYTTHGNIVEIDENGKLEERTPDGQVVTATLVISRDVGAAASKTRKILSRVEVDGPHGLDNIALEDQLNPEIPAGGRSYEYCTDEEDPTKSRISRPGDFYKHNFTRAARSGDSPVAVFPSEWIASTIKLFRDTRKLGEIEVNEPRFREILERTRDHLATKELDTIDEINILDFLNVLLELMNNTGLELDQGLIEGNEIPESEHVIAQKRGEDHARELLSGNMELLKKFIPALEKNPGFIDYFVQAQGFYAEHAVLASYFRAFRLLAFSVFQVDRENMLLGLRFYRAIQSADAMALLAEEESYLTDTGRRNYETSLTNLDGTSLANRIEGTEPLVVGKALTIADDELEAFVDENFDELQAKLKGTPLVGQSSGDIDKDGPSAMPDGFTVLTLAASLDGEEIQRRGDAALAQCKTVDEIRDEVGAKFEWQMELCLGLAGSSSSKEEVRSMVGKLDPSMLTPVDRFYKTVGSMLDIARKRFSKKTYALYQMLAASALILKAEETIKARQPAMSLRSRSVSAAPKESIPAVYIPALPSVYKQMAVAANAQLKHFERFFQQGHEALDAKMKEKINEILGIKILFEGLYKETAKYLGKEIEQVVPIESDDLNRTVFKKWIETGNIGNAKPVSVPVQYIQSDDPGYSGWVNFVAGGAWRGRVSTVDEQRANFGLYHVMRIFTDGQRSLTTADLAEKMNDRTNAEKFKNPEGVQELFPEASHVDFFVPVDSEITPEGPESLDITTTVSYAVDEFFRFVMGMQNVITGDITGDLYDAFEEVLREGEPDIPRSVSEPSPKIEAMVDKYNSEMGQKAQKDPFFLDYAVEEEILENVAVKILGKKLENIEIEIMEGISFRNNQGRAVLYEMVQSGEKVKFRVSEGFLLYEALIEEKGIGDSKDEVSKTLMHEANEQYVIRNELYGIRTPEQYHAALSDKNHPLYNPIEAKLLRDIKNFVIKAVATSEDTTFLPSLKKSANAIATRMLKKLEEKSPSPQNRKKRERIVEDIIPPLEELAKVIGVDNELVNTPLKLMEYLKKRQALGLDDLSRNIMRIVSRGGCSFSTTPTLEGLLEIGRTDYNYETGLDPDNEKDIDLIIQVIKEESKQIPFPAQVTQAVHYAFEEVGAAMAEAAGITLTFQMQNRINEFLTRGRAVDARGDEFSPDILMVKEVIEKHQDSKIYFDWHFLKNKIESKFSVRLEEIGLEGAKVEAKKAIGLSFLVNNKPALISFTVEEGKVSLNISEGLLLILSMLPKEEQAELLDKIITHEFREYEYNKFMGAANVDYHRFLAQTDDPKYASERNMLRSLLGSLVRLIAIRQIRNFPADREGYISAASAWTGLSTRAFTNVGKATKLITRIINQPVMTGRAVAPKPVETVLNEEIASVYADYGPELAVEYLKKLVFEVTMQTRQSAEEWERIERIFGSISPILLRVYVTTRNKLGMPLLGGMDTEENKKIVRNASAHLNESTFLLRGWINLRQNPYNVAAVSDEVEEQITGAKLANDVINQIEGGDHEVELIAGYVRDSFVEMSGRMGRQALMREVIDFYHHFISLRRPFGELTQMLCGYVIQHIGEKFADGYNYYAQIYQTKRPSEIKRIVDKAIFEGVFGPKKIRVTDEIEYFVVINKIKAAVGGFDENAVKEFICEKLIDVRNSWYENDADQRLRIALHYSMELVIYVFEAFKSDTNNMRKARRILDNISPAFVALLEMKRNAVDHPSYPPRSRAETISLMKANRGIELTRAISGLKRNRYRFKGSLNELQLNSVTVEVDAKLLNRKEAIHIYQEGVSKPVLTVSLISENLKVISDTLTPSFAYKNKYTVYLPSERGAILIIEKKDQSIIISIQPVDGTTPFNFGKRVAHYGVYVGPSSQSQTIKESEDDGIEGKPTALGVGVQNLLRILKASGKVLLARFLEEPCVKFARELKDAAEYINRTKRGVGQLLNQGFTKILKKYAAILGIDISELQTFFYNIKDQDMVQGPEAAVFSTMGLGGKGLKPDVVTVGLANVLVERLNKWLKENDAINGFKSPREYIETLAIHEIIEKIALNKKYEGSEAYERFSSYLLEFGLDVERDRTADTFHAYLRYRAGMDSSSPYYQKQVALLDSMAELMVFQSQASDASLETKTGRYAPQPRREEPLYDETSVDIDEGARHGYLSLFGEDKRNELRPHDPNFSGDFDNNEAEHGNPFIDKDERFRQKLIDEGLGGGAPLLSARPGIGISEQAAKRDVIARRMIRKLVPPLPAKRKKATPNVMAILGPVSFDKYPPDSLHAGLGNKGSRRRDGGPVGGFVTPKIFAGWIRQIPSDRNVLKKIAGEIVERRQFSPGLESDAWEALSGQPEDVLEEISGLVNKEMDLLSVKTEETATEIRSVLMDIVRGHSSEWQEKTLSLLRVILPSQPVEAGDVSTTGTVGTIDSSEEAARKRALAAGREAIDNGFLGEIKILAGKYGQQAGYKKILAHVRAGLIEERFYHGIHILFVNQRGNEFSEWDEPGINDDAKKEFLEKNISFTFQTPWFPELGPDHPFTLTEKTEFIPGSHLSIMWKKLKGYEDSQAKIKVLYTDKNGQEVVAKGVVKTMRLREAAFGMYPSVFIVGHSELISIQEISEVEEVVQGQSEAEEVSFRRKQGVVLSLVTEMTELVGRFEDSPVKTRLEAGLGEVRSAVADAQNSVALNDSIHSLKEFVPDFSDVDTNRVPEHTNPVVSRILECYYGIANYETLMKAANLEDTGLSVQEVIKRVFSVTSRAAKNISDETSKNKGGGRIPGSQGKQGMFNYFIAAGIVGIAALIVVVSANIFSSLSAINFIQYFFRNLSTLLNMSLGDGARYSILGPVLFFSALSALVIMGIVLAVQRIRENILLSGYCKRGEVENIALRIIETGEIDRIIQYMHRKGYGDIEEEVRRLVKLNLKKNALLKLTGRLRNIAGSFHLLKAHPAEAYGIFETIDEIEVRIRAINNDNQFDGLQKWIISIKGRIDDNFHHLRLNTLNLLNGNRIAEVMPNATHREVWDEMRSIVGKLMAIDTVEVQSIPEKDSNNPAGLNERLSESGDAVSMAAVGSSENIAAASKADSHGAETVPSAKQDSEKLLIEPLGEDRSGMADDLIDAIMEGNDISNYDFSGKYQEIVVRAEEIRRASGEQDAAAFVGIIHMGVEDASFDSEVRTQKLIGFLAKLEKLVAFLEGEETGIVEDFAWVRSRLHEAKPDFSGLITEIAEKVIILVNKEQPDEAEDYIEGIFSECGKLYVAYSLYQQFDEAKRVWEFVRILNPEIRGHGVGYGYKGKEKYFINFDLDKEEVVLSEGLAEDTISKILAKKPQTIPDARKGTADRRSGGISGAGLALMIALFGGVMIVTNVACDRGDKTTESAQTQVDANLLDNEWVVVADSDGYAEPEYGTGGSIAGWTLTNQSDSFGFAEVDLQENDYAPPLSLAGRELKLRVKGRKGARHIWVNVYEPNGDPDNPWRVKLDIPVNADPNEWGDSVEMRWNAANHGLPSQAIRIKLEFGVEAGGEPGNDVGAEIVVEGFTCDVAGTASAAAHATTTGELTEEQKYTVVQRMIENIRKMGAFFTAGLALFIWWGIGAIHRGFEGAIAAEAPITEETVVETGKAAVESGFAPVYYIIAGLVFLVGVIVIVSLIKAGRKRKELKEQEQLFNYTEQLRKFDNDFVVKALGSDNSITRRAAGKVLNERYNDTANRKMLLLTMTRVLGQIHNQETMFGILRLFAEWLDVNTKDVVITVRDHARAVNYFQLVTSAEAILDQLETKEEAERKKEGRFGTNLPLLTIFIAAIVTVLALAGAAEGAELVLVSSEGISLASFIWTLVKAGCLMLLFGVGLLAMKAVDRIELGVIANGILSEGIKSSIRLLTSPNIRLRKAARIALRKGYKRKDKKEEVISSTIETLRKTGDKELKLEIIALFKNWLDPRTEDILNEIAVIANLSGDDEVNNAALTAVEKIEKKHKTESLAQGSRDMNFSLPTIFIAAIVTVLVLAKSAGAAEILGQAKGEIFSIMANISGGWWFVIGIIATVSVIGIYKLGRWIINKIITRKVKRDADGNGKATVDVRSGIIERKAKEASKANIEKQFKALARWAKTREDYDVELSEDGKYGKISKNNLRESGAEFNIIFENGQITILSSLMQSGSYIEIKCDSFSLQGFSMEPESGQPVRKIEVPITNYFLHFAVNKRGGIVAIVAPEFEGEYQRNMNNASPYLSESPVGIVTSDSDEINGLEFIGVSKEDSQFGEFIGALTEPSRQSASVEKLKKTIINEALPFKTREGALISLNNIISEEADAAYVEIFNIVRRQESKSGGARNTLLFGVVKQIEVRKIADARSDIREFLHSSREAQQETEESEKLKVPNDLRLECVSTLGEIGGQEEIIVLAEELDYINEEFHKSQSRLEGTSLKKRRVSVRRKTRQRYFIRIKFALKLIADNTGDPESVVKILEGYTSKDAETQPMIGQIIAAIRGEESETTGTPVITNTVPTVVMDPPENIPQVGRATPHTDMMAVDGSPEEGTQGITSGWIINRKPAAGSTSDISESILERIEKLVGEKVQGIQEDSDIDKQSIAQFGRFIEDFKKGIVALPVKYEIDTKKGRTTSGHTALGQKAMMLHHTASVRKSAAKETIGYKKIINLLRDTINEWRRRERGYTRNVMIAIAEAIHKKLTEPTPDAGLGVGPEGGMASMMGIQEWIQDGDVEMLAREVDNAPDSLERATEIREAILAEKKTELIPDFERVVREVKIINRLRENIAVARINNRLAYEVKLYVFELLDEERVDDAVVFIEGILKRASKLYYDTLEEEVERNIPKAVAAPEIVLEFLSKINLLINASEAAVLQVGDKRTAKYDKMRGEISIAYGVVELPEGLAKHTLGKLMEEANQRVSKIKAPAIYAERAGAPKASAVAVDAAATVIDNTVKCTSMFDTLSETAARFVDIDRTRVNAVIELTKDSQDSLSVDMDRAELMAESEMNAIAVCPHDYSGAKIDQSKFMPTGFSVMSSDGNAYSINVQKVSASEEGKIYRIVKCDGPVMAAEVVKAINENPKLQKALELTGVVDVFETANSSSKMAKVINGSIEFEKTLVVYNATKEKYGSLSRDEQAAFDTRILNTPTKSKLQKIQRMMRAKKQGPLYTSPNAEFITTGPVSSMNSRFIDENKMVIGTFVMDDVDLSDGNIVRQVKEAITKIHNAKKRAGFTYRVNDVTRMKADILSRLRMGFKFIKLDLSAFQNIDVLRGYLLNLRKSINPDVTISILEPKNSVVSQEVRDALVKDKIMFVTMMSVSELVNADLSGINKDSAVEIMLMDDNQITDESMGEIRAKLGTLAKKAGIFGISANILQDLKDYKYSRGEAEQLGFLDYLSLMLQGKIEELVNDPEYQYEKGIADGLESKGVLGEDLFEDAISVLNFYRSIDPENPEIDESTIMVRLESVIKAGNLKNYNSPDSDQDKARIKYAVGFLYGKLMRAAKKKFIKKNRPFVDASHSDMFSRMIVEAWLLGIRHENISGIISEMKARMTDAGYDDELRGIHAMIRKVHMRVNKQGATLTEIYPAVSEIINRLSNYAIKSGEEPNSIVIALLLEMIEGFAERNEKTIVERIKNGTGSAFINATEALKAAS